MGAISFENKLELGLVSLPRLFPSLVRPWEEAQKLRG